MRSKFEKLIILICNYTVFMRFYNNRNIGVKIITITAFLPESKEYVHSQQFAVIKNLQAMVRILHLHTVIGTINIDMPYMLKSSHFSPFEFHTNTNLTIINAFFE